MEIENLENFEIGSINYFGKKVYFGERVMGISGNLIRHLAFHSLVKWLKKNNKTNKKIKILEVGVWAGGSTISWLKALKKEKIDFEYFAIDTWLPGYDEEHIKKNNHYKLMNESTKDNLIFDCFKHNVRTELKSKSYKFKVIKGNSINVMKTLPSESFDLISIDGDHRYEACFSDLSEAKRLLIPGGLLVGDDLELKPSEIEQNDLNKDVNSGFEWINLDIPQGGYHPGVTKSVNECFDDVGYFEGLFYAAKSIDKNFYIPEINLPSKNVYKFYKLPYEKLPKWLMRSFKNLLRPVKKFIKG